ncbi:hypothetical protein R5R35_013785 [Gryllus longicercus]|uniref:SAM domain-containing protein n=1 Tax=Gryllus longicercus TaxID=2509291 RepID=A0AAN9WMS2_9ORTH
MYTIFKTGIILCLVITCGCNGDKSETGTVPEAQQERTLKTSFSSANLLRSGSSQSVVNEAVHHVTPSFEAAIGEGCNDDVACLTLASHDRIGLEAIRSLHRQLDDDANGNVDLSESDEFLRQELQYEDGYERRQRVFHRNDDNHISVRELWEAWIRSEVHNWTVEQTSDWLSSSVELPQYAENFKLHKVTGAMLPRLAVNNMHYLSNVLGIKDPIHKQKIALKAMDVVLFGSPKDTGHSVKDLILVTALLLALTGCYYAYRKTKSSQNDVRRMIKHMESLQKAELALDQLQKELEKARMEQEFVTTEKQNLERLLEQGGDNMELRTSSSDLEVSQLKAEIEMLRGELKRAEGELEDRCWSPPVGLQQWLQLTHEIENKGYIKKKMAAEKQLQQAREACEKLRKKRSSLVGAFVSTHGKSIDDVDRSIVEARTSLNEVTQELQERVHRWKQIELLCGFNIVNNSGLQYLESILYRGTANGRGGSSMGLRGRMSSSQDDLDDDTSSLYSPSAGCLESFQWKEGADSSGSEAGKGELDDDFQTDSRSLTSNVHFIVGSDSWSEEMGKTRMSRSFSQDPSLILGERESSPPNMSLSETCLDGKQQTTPRITPLKKSSRDFSSREYVSKDSREHGFRDSSRDHGSRESSSRDHSSRESSAKDHGSKESSYKDHGSRESSGKDHASRESTSRDHGSREMSSREHVPGGHTTKEHLLREPGKDHVIREISPRDLASQDRAVRELAIVPYERSSKEHVLRDPMLREGIAASRDQAVSKAEQMVSLDDETYSTDSNSTTEEDLRRKKRKLFPTFNRKHKTKTS